MKSTITVEFVNLIEGTDSLTGKKSKGATVIIHGKERFLSWKSLQQIIGMEFAPVIVSKMNDESPLFDNRMKVPAGNHDEE